MIVVVRSNISLIVYGIEKFMEQNVSFKIEQKKIYKNNDIRLLYILL